jgi:hypothetical protein
MIVGNTQCRPDRAQRPRRRPTRQPLLRGGDTVAARDSRSRYDGPVLANQDPSALQTSADTPLTVSMPYCSDAFPFVSTAIR